MAHGIRKVKETRARCGRAPCSSLRRRRGAAISDTALPATATLRRFRALGNSVVGSCLVAWPIALSKRTGSDGPRAGRPGLAPLLEDLWRLPACIIAGGHGGKAPISNSRWVPEFVGGCLSLRSGLDQHLRPWLAGNDSR